MTRRFFPLILLTTVLVLAGTLPAARAADEAQERAELAKAMGGAKVTLQDGLKASVSQGKPISAKFEVEGDTLQLSVYTMKGNGFSEVVVNPASGKVNKAETITDKEDLEHAQAQKAAMDKAKTTLLTAADNAAKSNAGYKVVSVVPQMKAGHPVADVTLLRGSAYKTVSEKLD
ncbi:MAG TPA: hypothetical protein VGB82_18750 [Alphaproteobacteria bacterium]